jgi:secretion/DNA translocation related TadE-like protein
MTAPCPPPRCSPRVVTSDCRERGSATVLGLGVLGVLVTVLVAGLVLGRVSMASGVARAAADLGAVAGAQVLRTEGSGAAVCTRVEDLVGANGADLQECRVVAGEEGRGPGLVVQVRAPTGLAPWPWAQGRARAGLVPADP